MFWRNHWVAIILFMVITLFYGFVIYHYGIPEKFKLFSDSTGDSEEWYALFMILFTFFLLLVAYFQLSSLGKTAKVDFLMKLDARYGSSEIIKARKIIHKFYRESKEELTNRKNINEVVFWHMIGVKIDALSEKNLTHERSDYVYLLNLLDYLESLSYYVNHGYVDREQIDDFMGISIEFFYTIFEPVIKRRRGKYGYDNFYSEFTSLYFCLKQRQIGDNCFLCRCINKLKEFFSCGC